MGDAAVFKLTKQVDHCKCTTTKMP